MIPVGLYVEVYTDFFVNQNQLSPPNPNARQMGCVHFVRQNGHRELSDVTSKHEVTIEHNLQSK